jgi:hypothetical protein
MAAASWHSRPFIAMDVVALYALCAHGSRQNMTA